MCPLPAANRGWAVPHGGLRPLEDSASIEPIPLDKERRANKEALATKEERELFDSGNGKISWLVRRTRMDIVFHLFGQQDRANDAELCVRALIAYDKLASVPEPEPSISASAT